MFMVSISARRVLTIPWQFLHTLYGFVKNASKSRLLTNSLKLKNVVDKDGVKLLVTIGFRKLMMYEDDVRRDLTISGSHKIQDIFTNYKHLFSKNVLQIQVVSS